MNLLRICMVLIAAATLVSPLSARAGADQFTEVLSLPIGETRYRVAAWLSRSGFATEQHHLQDGGVNIVASRGDEKEVVWSVQLIPDSTLGTKIAIMVEGDEGGVDQVSELFESLHYQGNDYRGSIAEPTPAIPESILNQIGNVACIYVQTKSKSLQFSGFFIDSDGLILCTAHDLREQENVKIKSNTGILYQGNIVRTDFERDLALIEVDAVKEDVVSLAGGRNLLAMGETIYTIGCPVNLRGTVHQGFINGPPRSYHESPIWQVEMQIQPGSSGSPVFDPGGNIVGMVKGKHRATGDTGFIIPLEIMVDFLKEYFSQ